MAKRPTCRIHHRALRCPSCDGARGGSVTSPAKAKAAVKNGRKGGRPPED